METFMNSSTPIDRAQINRQNAAHSTGPVTIEGRRRVSVNALRHGLTGHTVVLPSEDLAAYQKHCAEFHTELKPQGLLESKCVQTIAEPSGCAAQSSLMMPKCTAVLASSLLRPPG
jgi:hypothetical protein